MPHQQPIHQDSQPAAQTVPTAAATPVAQTRLAEPSLARPVQLAAPPNNTGLPDNLKSGIENLSGYSMDDVQVHYNSSKPAQLNAHAYAQGTDIHVSPGQERHLPHEAWHVVQKKQGRVKATTQLRSKVAINDDQGLEKEASLMGQRALGQTKLQHQTLRPVQRIASRPVLQRVTTKDGTNIAVDWARLSQELAKAYLAKITRGGWQATPNENTYLQAVADQENIPRDTPANVPDALPGGTFHGFAPVTDRAIGGKVTWRSLDGAPAPPNSLSLLESAFAELRIKRTLSKREYEQRHLQVQPGENVSRERLFGNTEGTINRPDRLDLTSSHLGYAKLLDELRDERALLLQTAPFQNNRLRLVGNTVEFNQDGARWAAIATIANGQTYQAEINAGEATERDVQNKNRPTATEPGNVKGQYIDDSRGVPTKRFAYAEKSFFQFMDFLAQNGHLAGRFQAFSKAIGVAHPNIFQNTNRNIGSRDQTQNLSLTQMATLHQWKGSGPQQRGLSLTSTKEGTVLSNAGESFREQGGFLITVDLAKVPDGVTLINHYSAGGVRDNLLDVPNKLRGDQNNRKGYNYKGSVSKNREIYLERLEAGWIHQVTWHHPVNGEQNPNKADMAIAPNDGGNALDLEQIKRNTGYDDYKNGFNEIIRLGRGNRISVRASVPSILRGETIANVLQNNYRTGINQLNPPRPGRASRERTNGRNSAKHYLKGFYHGLLRKRIHREDEEFKTITKAHADIPRGRYQAIGGLDKPPDIYWIGFGHGFQNKEMQLFGSEFFNA